VLDACPPRIEITSAEISRVAGSRAEQSLGLSANNHAFPRRSARDVFEGTTEIDIIGAYGTASTPCSPSPIADGELGVDPKWQNRDGRPIRPDPAELGRSPPPQTSQLRNAPLDSSRRPGGPRGPGGMQKYFSHTGRANAILERVQRRETPAVAPVGPVRQGCSAQGWAIEILVRRVNSVSV